MIRLTTTYIRNKKTGEKINFSTESSMPYAKYRKYEKKILKTKGWKYEDCSICYL